MVHDVLHNMIRFARLLGFLVVRLALLRRPFFSRSILTARVICVSPDVLYVIIVGLRTVQIRLTCIISFCNNCCMMSSFKRCTILIYFRYAPLIRSVIYTFRVRGTLQYLKMSTTTRNNTSLTGRTRKKFPDLDECNDCA